MHQAILVFSIWWILYAISVFLLLYLCSYSHLLNMSLSLSLVLYLPFSVLRSSYVRVFVSVYLHDVLRTCCYLVFVSYSALNTVLCVSMFVSFICKLFLLVLYMCYFSIMFKCFPFLYVLIQCICYGPVFMFCV